jgi:hypothetical protein
LAEKLFSGESEDELQVWMATVAAVLIQDEGCGCRGQDYFGLPEGQQRAGRSGAVLAE